MLGRVSWHFLVDFQNFMVDASLPLLIQQMLQSAFYPHPTVEPIQLIQTHISYVLLTGEYAYKIKKPLDFGFLNYSTLEKRRHFCQEELRLNQRGAAMLYLDVLPITRVGDRVLLGGEGTPIEYAVKMRQFPQETLLSQIFERGELTETRLRELAEVVAAYHLKAETNDYIRTFGEIAKIRPPFDQNYEQTEAYIGGPQTQTQFDQTKAYTNRFFAEQQMLFADRAAQNWIRACHGDLHLGNICFWQDQLLLFDCIEFNEPFRLVDVMFDIAYIVMDLVIKQRLDLCSVFLNHYIEQTGDWEGLQILPLYVSRQSYVRGKVTSFMLDDPSVSPEVKAAAKKKAALYYQLAWDYVQPRPGQLFLMSGLSGSGKSTTARRLAQRIGAIHIRADAVRKHLASVPLHEPGGVDLYTPAFSQQTYERLLNLGITLASQGYSVILDAKYDRQANRQAAIAQAQAHNLPLQILHCTAAADVLRDRLQNRTADIADATVAVLAQQTMDPFTELVQPYVTTIDTTQDIDQQLAIYSGSHLH